MYDREGALLVTSVAGDTYLTDQTHTKGHQGAVTGIAWMPASGTPRGSATATVRDTLLSSSIDGTVRCWDAGGKLNAFGELPCGDVMRFKNARGGRAGVTAFAISPDGRVIVAGCDDGSVQRIAFRAPGHSYARVDAAVRGAHASGSTITAVVFSPDGSRVATRATDGQLLVWAAGALTNDRVVPSAIVKDIESVGLGDAFGVSWSPDSSLLLTGTAAARQVDGSVGSLLVFEVTALEAAWGKEQTARNAGGGAGTGAGGGGSDGLVAMAVVAYRASVAPGASVTSVVWHAKLNQVALGCGDGGVRMLYGAPGGGAGVSTKGALLSSARAIKRSTDLDFSQGAIFAPNALPLYKEAAGPLWADTRAVRNTALAAKEAREGRLPAKPSSVPAFLTGAKRSFTDQYLRDHPPAGGGGNIREQDAQAVLQSYAGRYEGFTSAYAQSQPTAVLAGTTLESELDASRRAPKRAREDGGT